jgi:phage gp46-like protein
VILRLCGLLHNGKLAKRLADQAIKYAQTTVFWPVSLSRLHSQCDAVQNLRKAILDYRMRAESAEPGRSQNRLRETAKSYLFRTPPARAARAIADRRTV